MSKNVIVNGKPHNGISFLELLTTEGASALFKDVDEVSSGGGMAGLAEVASGVFTVTAATAGSTNPSHADAVIIEHGLSGEPDGYAVFAKQWYDTQDSSFVSTIRVHGQNVLRGRRSLESNTWYNVGGDVSGDVTATSICLLGASYAKFMPTYIDNEGNEGQQEYIWIAWRMAE